MKVIVTGDIQIGEPSQVPAKRGLVDTIVRENPRLFIHCGDVTSLGENNNLLNKLYYRLYNACCISCGIERVNTESPTQLDEYNALIQPIRDRGIEILECLGNHDVYAHPIKPVKSYIKRQYGNTYYKREYEGLTIFCLDIYPTKKISDWLSVELKALGEDTPFVCFFHYPVVGPLSDWWEENEKQYFLNIIHRYNCLGLFVGHTHESQIHTVNIGNKVIMQYDGSGSQYVDVTWIDGNLTCVLAPNS